MTSLTESFPFVVESTLPSAIAFTVNALSASGASGAAVMVNIGGGSFGAHSMTFAVTPTGSELMVTDSGV
jgi:hypothetical protein